MSPTAREVEADFLAALTASRLVAIVRGRDLRATVAAALTIVEEGIALVEISLTGAGALDALREVAGRCGAGTWVGAGTVLTDDDAVAARDAGAQFVVSPALGGGVVRSRQLGLPVLAGAFTPTEILTAHAAASAVKLFPASLGGVDYLRAVRAPFPDVPIVPVGGVDHALARGYLCAGAVAVGVGSPLVGDAAEAGGDLDALRHRARELREAVWCD